VDGDVALRVAPGLRFRVDAADGRWAGGCDGSRIWQWRANAPSDAWARFDDRPRPPAEVLLAPSWLLSGDALTIEGTVTVCGRDGVLVSAVPPGRRRPSRIAQHRHRVGWYERVTVVVDSELGILLRCELFPGGPDTEVTEFTDLTADVPADQEPLAPPPGSVFGDGHVPGDGSVIDDVLAGLLGKTGLAAAKTAGELAAGGLGALVRYGPARGRDPSGQARADDPDAAMPAAEELPGWARTATGAADAPPDQAGPPPGDALLHLLYRGQLEPVPFTATVHQWDNLALRLAAAAAPTRRPGI
jgi:hypothetical protein